MKFEKFESFSQKIEQVGSREQKERDIERKRGIETLNSKIEEDVERLREFLPLTAEGRIDPNSFEEVYSREKIEEDKKWTQAKEEEYKSRGNPEARKKGELREKVTLLILNKFFGPLITVRTAEIDDKKRHSDFLFFDPESGKVICGADSGSPEGPLHQEKKKTIFEKNIGVLPGEGGVKIDYGAILRKRGDKIETILTSLSRLPLFGVYISDNEMEEYLQTLGRQDYSETEKIERKIARNITQNFQEQAATLKKEKLHPRVAEGIESFEKVLNSISKNLENKEQ